MANNFDKDKVQKEINTQVEVTKRFDQNRQEVKAEINKKMDQAKSENQSILDKQKNKVALTTEEQEQLSAYNKKVENYQRLGVLLDVVASGLSSPTNSGLGIAASNLSPVASYEIGQYFKAKGTEGSSAHILAHTVLGAAVAAAGGNDTLTAGLIAGGAEAAAPVLSNFLYGKKASDLTAEEKSTISVITGLVATGIGGVASGDIATAVQSGQGAQNAVENNILLFEGKVSEKNKILKLFNASSESHLQFNFDAKGRLIPVGYHYDDSKEPPVLVGASVLKSGGVIDAAVIKAMKEANTILMVLDSDAAKEYVNIDDFFSGKINTTSLNNPENKIASSQLLHIIIERMETLPNYEKVVEIYDKLSELAVKTNALEKKYGSESKEYKDGEAYYKKVEAAVQNTITQSFYTAAHQVAIDKEYEYVKQLFPDRNIMRPSDKRTPGKPYMLNGIKVVDDVVDFGEVKAVITSEYKGMTPDNKKVITGNVIKSRYE